MNTTLVPGLPGYQKRAVSEACSLLHSDQLDAEEDAHRLEASDALADRPGKHGERRFDRRRE